MDFAVNITIEDLLKTEAVPERRGQTLNVRVPKSLKENLEQLAEFLTAKQRLLSKDAKEVTAGDVVVRMLKAGIESAWTNAKLPVKPSKADVDALLQSMKSAS